MVPPQGSGSRELHEHQSRGRGGWRMMAFRITTSTSSTGRFRGLPQSLLQHLDRRRRETAAYTVEMRHYLRTVCRQSHRCLHGENAATAMLIGTASIPKTRTSSRLAVIGLRHRELRTILRMEQCTCRMRPGMQISHRRSSSQKRCSRPSRHRRQNLRWTCRPTCEKRSPPSRSKSNWRLPPAIRTNSTNSTSACRTSFPLSETSSMLRRHRLAIYPVIYTPEGPGIPGHRLLASRCRAT